MNRLICLLIVLIIVNYATAKSDYPSPYDEKLPRFKRIKDQVRLVVLGDSRSDKGVNPRYFFGEENRKYPMAFNLACNSCGLRLNEILIRDYLIYASNLEWVVYGTSPRIFNRYWSSGVGKTLEKSRGHRDHVKNGGEGWKTKNTQRVRAEDRERGMSDWGFSPSVDKPSGNMKERLKSLEKATRKGRYQFSEERLEQFEHMIQLLQKRGVKLLAFTPPWHPAIAGRPCTDDDGTTLEGYDDFVRRMKRLEGKYPNFHFEDIDKKGRSGFKPEYFRDPDHLNDRGARELTLLLSRIIGEIENKTGSIVP